MADICPRCAGTDIAHDFNYAHCLTCGAALTPGDSGTFTDGSDSADWPVSKPADTSLATPTATPVYAEQEKDRQPAVDTNLEPVPSDAPPGPNEKPAPEKEAVNVAGELSDETPEEKKAGGPSDQPRTAELTKTGKPSKDALVDHANDEQPQPEFTEPTEADQTDLSATPGAADTQEQP